VQATLASFLLCTQRIRPSYKLRGRIRGGLSGASYKRFIWDRLTKIYPVHLLTLLIVLPIAIWSPQTPSIGGPFPCISRCCSASGPRRRPRSLIFEQAVLEHQLRVAVLPARPRGDGLCAGEPPSLVPVAVTVGYALGLGLFLWHDQSETVRLYLSLGLLPRGLWSSWRVSSWPVCF